MPQFFIEKNNIQENKIFITKNSDVLHLTKVLRCKKKDELLLAGPDNIFYQVEITAVKNDVIETSIKNYYESDRKLNLNITLAQSIIKSNKQDFLIQKATELGVKDIIPFISKNTVVKINTEKDRQQKEQRWQKIVYESSKQCQRGDLAEIKNITTFSDIANLEGFDLTVFCAEKNANITIKQFLQDNKNKIKPDSKVLLIIGPEGGWDDSEMETLINQGAVPVTLGKLILRAETAVTTALSQIVYEYEL